jgi:sugar lactone lactonase YvrE
MRAALVLVAVAIACDSPAPAKQAVPAPAPGSAAPVSIDAAPAPAPAHAPGSWEHVGQAGGWADTRLATTIGDHLYTIEQADGRLWDTTLSTGAWVAIGKPEFGDSTNLFAAGGVLYSFETDGSMYRIDASTGAWQPIGKPGTWKAKRLAVAVGDHIFAIENADGRLWKIDVASGAYVAIGAPEFATATRLIPAGAALYELDDAGSLYRVDVDTGARTAVGAPGAWARTRYTAVVGDSLYSVEHGDGRLWKTALATGTYTVIGKPDFGRTRRLVGTADLLYSIEDDGSLYRIYP